MSWYASQQERRALEDIARIGPVTALHASVEAVARAPTRPSRAGVPGLSRDKPRPALQQGFSRRCW
jgi:hypothetical protein